MPLLTFRDVADALRRHGHAAAADRIIARYYPEEGFSGGFVDAPVGAATWKPRKPAPHSSDPARAPMSLIRTAIRQRVRESLGLLKKPSPATPAAGHTIHDVPKLLSKHGGISVHHRGLGKGMTVHGSDAAGVHAARAHLEKHGFTVGAVRSIAHNLHTFHVGHHTSPKQQEAVDEAGKVGDPSTARRVGANLHLGVEGVHKIIVPEHEHQFIHQVADGTRPNHGFYADSGHKYLASREGDHVVFRKHLDGGAAPLKVPASAIRKVFESSVDEGMRATRKARTIAAGHHVDVEWMDHDVKGEEGGDRHGRARYEHHLDATKRHGGVISTLPGTHPSGASHVIRYSFPSAAHKGAFQRDVARGERPGFYESVEEAVGYPGKGAVLHHVDMADPDEHMHLLHKHAKAVGVPVHRDPMSGERYLMAHPNLAKLVHKYMVADGAKVEITKHVGKAPDTHVESVTLTADELTEALALNELKDASQHHIVAAEFEGDEEHQGAHHKRFAMLATKHGAKLVTGAKGKAVAHFDDKVAARGFHDTAMKLAGHKGPLYGTTSFKRATVRESSLVEKAPVGGHVAGLGVEVDSHKTHHTVSGRHAVNIHAARQRLTALGLRATKVKYADGKHHFRVFEATDEIVATLNAAKVAPLDGKSVNEATTGTDIVKVAKAAKVYDGHAVETGVHKTWLSGPQAEHHIVKHLRDSGYLVHHPRRGGFMATHPSGHTVDGKDVSDLHGGKPTYLVTASKSNSAHNASVRESEDVLDEAAAPKPRHVAGGHDLWGHSVDVPHRKVKGVDYDNHYQADHPVHAAEHEHYTAIAKKHGAIRHDPVDHIHYPNGRSQVLSGHVFPTRAQAAAFIADAHAHPPVHKANEDYDTGAKGAAQVVVTFDQNADPADNAIQTAWMQAINLAKAEGGVAEGLHRDGATSKTWQGRIAFKDRASADKAVASIRDMRPARKVVTGTVATTGSPVTANPGNQVRTSGDQPHDGDTVKRVESVDEGVVHSEVDGDHEWRVHRHDHGQGVGTVTTISRGRVGGKHHVDIATHTKASGLRHADWRYPAGKDAMAKAAAVLKNADAKHESVDESLVGGKSPKRRSLGSRLSANRKLGQPKGHDARAQSRYHAAWRRRNQGKLTRYRSKYSKAGEPGKIVGKD